MIFLHFLARFRPDLLCMRMEVANLLVTIGQTALNMRVHLPDGAGWRFRARETSIPAHADRETVRECLVCAAAGFSAGE